MAKDTVKVNARELNELADKLAKAARDTEFQSVRALRTFALLIGRKAKEKIQKGSRSGRTYTRRSVTHVASASGEPPKTDSGRLVASIRPVFTDRFSAEVGSLSNIAIYGGMLEEGTKNMAARPWLEPTLKENESALQGLFTAAIKTGGLAD